MLFIQLIKNLRLLPFLALPLLAWLLPSGQEEVRDHFHRKKSTSRCAQMADGLLRASGDSTSRIPTIEQSSAGVWRVRLEQPFEYAQLPALLEGSLKLHGIQRPYEVAVRRCLDSTIDLGYHQFDFLENKVVPCQGREEPDGCHYLEITFLDNSKKWPLSPWKTGALVLTLAGLAVFWFFKRKKTSPAAPTNTAIADTDWMDFGNSRLDVAGQYVPVCRHARDAHVPRNKIAPALCDQPRPPARTRCDSTAGLGR